MDFKGCQIREVNGAFEVLRPTFSVLGQTGWAHAATLPSLEAAKVYVVALRKLK